MCSKNPPRIGWGAPSGAAGDMGAAPPPLPPVSGRILGAIGRPVRGSYKVSARFARGAWAWDRAMQDAHEEIATRPLAPPA